MITIIEAIPEYYQGLSRLVLVLSNPDWPEGTKEFMYKVNDNATLTLIRAD